MPDALGPNGGANFGPLWGGALDERNAYFGSSTGGASAVRLSDGQRVWYTPAELHPRQQGDALGGGDRDSRGRVSRRFRRTAVGTWQAATGGRCGHSRLRARSIR